MQQKEVLACRGAGCNVTGVAKRWETAKTLISLEYLTLNTQEPQGSLCFAAFLQGRCGWSEWLCMNTTHGSARGSKHIQRCWHNQEQAMGHQQQDLCHWWLCCLSFKIYWSAFLFTIFFFFLIPRLQCWFVFKWRAKSRRGEGSSADWSRWPWQGIDHTGASDPLLNKSSTQPLNIPACCCKDGLHLSLPLHPAPFPAEGDCNWLPVKAKATHKGVSQQ